MRAKRSTHCSDGARRACASSIIRMMPASAVWRSEEHKSELQSLKRNSYAGFCLKKKKKKNEKKVVYTLDTELEQINNEKTNRYSEENSTKQATERTENNNKKMRDNTLKQTLHQTNIMKTIRVGRQ